MSVGFQTITKQFAFWQQAALPSVVVSSPARLRAEMCGALLFCAALAPCPVDAEPLTVWNQAYQETYQADRLEVISVEARNAYILLDPFVFEVEGGWASYVAALKANGNEVGAYISIGTGEDWRSDFATLKPGLVAKEWDAWGGEYFVDRADDRVIGVMKARLDRIAALGFDWVEFDNMDWAFDDGNRATYGFHISEEDSLIYAHDLCVYAHLKGLKCMAKSMVEGVPIFDGATYESYEDSLGWWDQEAARDLLAAGKPVIIIHYDSPDCAGVLDHYLAYYGRNLSFLCETEAANGYVRLPRN